MRRYILSFFVLILLSTIVKAQVGNLIEDMSCSVDMTQVVGNSVNNNLFVFYDAQVSGSEKKYICRIMNTAGAPGPQIVIDDGLDPWAFPGSQMCAAWNSVSETYLVSYSYQGAIRVRVLDANGNILGSKKRVADCDHLNYTLTTVKDKFMLFINRDNNIYGTTILSNGGIYEGEKKLTNFAQGSGDLYLGNAVEQSNDKAVAYFTIEKLSSAEQKTLLLQVDEKMVSIDMMLIDSTPLANIGLLLGYYDPVDERHALIKNKTLYIFNNTGTLVKDGGQIIPIDNPVKGLTFNSKKKHFLVLSVCRFHIPSVKEGSRFYLSQFNRYGVFTAEELQKFETYHVTRWWSKSIGLNSLGDILITWGYDTGIAPSKVWGMFYKSNSFYYNFPWHKALYLGISHATFGSGS